MDLKGRVAFVTGGSGGIGSSIVQALAMAGADIVVGFNGNRVAALDICAAVKTLGQQSEAVQIDQTDSGAAAAAVNPSCRPARQSRAASPVGSAAAASSSVWVSAGSPRIS